MGRRLKPVPDELKQPKPQRPRGILLSDVEPEDVEWLWEGRIPRGKITIVEGNPGQGKSAFTTDLAARVSVGRPFPDGAECGVPEGGAGVVLLNAEDGLADTIRPRLDATGGDPTKVLSVVEIPDELRPGQDRIFTIPDDLAGLEEDVKRMSAALVIIDPLMAFLSGEVNAHKDQDIRRALTPLSKMAERTGAAVVVVRHHNKTQGGDVLHKGGGSIGIIGAARMGLVVAPDPNDPDEERKVLAGMKENITKRATSLAFKVVSSSINGAARVEWLGESELGARELTRAPMDDDERTALDEAIDFLRDALSDGPMTVNAVKKDAKGADISEATLRRAKSRLGVKSDKHGGEFWSWSLPDKPSRTPVEDEHLEHLEHLPIPKPDSGDGEGAQAPEHEHLQTTLEHLPDGDNSRYLSEGAQGAQGAQVKRAGAGEACKHDAVGGCWLCKKNHPEEWGSTS